MRCERRETGRCANTGLGGHLALCTDDCPILYPARSEPTGAFSRSHLLNLFTRAPRAFWRFDVDISLDAAVRMAEFAQIAGVQGVFYLMATSGEYNAFSPAGVQAIGRIRDCGHKVGMHVDERTDDTPIAAMQRAARLFDSSRVASSLVSFHMPSPRVLWVDMGAPAFESAYAARWRGRYVSDSRREWCQGKEDLLVAGGGEGMQCALHPEHWFGSS